MKRKQENKKFVLFKLDRGSNLLKKLDSVKIQNERKEVQSIFENNLELIFPNCVLIKSEFIFPYKVAEKDKRGWGSKKCDCQYKIGDDYSFKKVFDLLETYLKNCIDK
jgi:hypothetical protein